MRRRRSWPPAYSSPAAVRARMPGRMTATRRRRRRSWSSRSFPRTTAKSWRTRFRPVVAAIEEVTGIPTRIEAVTNNAGVIEAQVAERVDIATYGAFSYYLASDVAEVTPVAKDQRTPEPGSGAVRSVGVVVPGLGHRVDRGCRRQERVLHRPCLHDGLPHRRRRSHRRRHRPRGRHQPGLRRLTRRRGDPDDRRRLRHRLRRGDLRDHDPSRARPHRRGRHRDRVDVRPDSRHPDRRRRLARRRSSATRSSRPSPATTPSPPTRPDCATTSPAKHPRSGARSTPAQTACLWGGTGAFAFEPADSSDYDVIGAICEALKTDVCRSEG